MLLNDSRSGREEAIKRVTETHKNGNGKYHNLKATNGVQGERDGEMKKWERRSINRFRTLLLIVLRTEQCKSGKTIARQLLKTNTHNLRN